LAASVYGTLTEWHVSTDKSVPVTVTARSAMFSLQTESVPAATFDVRACRRRLHAAVGRSIATTASRQYDDHVQRTVVVAFGAALAYQRSFSLGAGGAMPAVDGDEFVYVEADGTGTSGAGTTASCGSSSRLSTVSGWQVGKRACLRDRRRHRCRLELHLHGRPMDRSEPDARDPNLCAATPLAAAIPDPCWGMAQLRRLDQRRRLRHYTVYNATAGRSRR